MLKVYGYLTSPIQTNTYLAFDETKEGFIVDPGGYSKSLADRAKSEGIHLGWILLTHGHGDHIAGIPGFRKEFPEIKVLASVKEKEFLLNPVNNGLVDYTSEPFGITCDRYVDDGEKMTIGNTEFTFISTPGHTPGGQVIYTPGFAFTGDTLFRLSIGRTDFYGGNYETLVKSIREKVYKLPPETSVLPGHMEESTIELEREHNPFVRP